MSQEPDRGREVEESAGPPTTDVLHWQEVVQSAGAHIDDLQGQVDALCEELGKAMARVTALEEALGQLRNNNYWLAQQRHREQNHAPENWGAESIFDCNETWCKGAAVDYRAVSELLAIEPRAALGKEARIEP